MNILAVETSGDYCSVALWRDGVVDERELPAEQRQSGLLIDMIRDLLRDKGLALAHVDGIAYGAGPGSFTGLRVACGVVQGMAAGAGKPVALMGGAGGSSAADLPDDVDVFVTGDVKYHEALDAAERGIAIIDAGHHGTEMPVLHFITGLLDVILPKLRVVQYNEPDPFTAVTGKR